MGLSTLASHLSGGFCQFTFLCLSLLFNWVSPVTLYYLRKQDDVKVGRRFGVLNQLSVMSEALVCRFYNAIGIVYPLAVDERVEHA